MKHLLAVPVAFAGAFVGYLVVTLVDGLTTGSNLSGLLGLVFGVPCGMVAALQIYYFVRRNSK